MYNDNVRYVVNRFVVSNVLNGETLTWECTVCMEKVTFVLATIDIPIRRTVLRRCTTKTFAFFFFLSLLTFSYVLRCKRIISSLLSLLCIRYPPMHMHTICQRKCYNWKTIIGGRQSSEQSISFYVSRSCFYWYFVPSSYLIVLLVTLPSLPFSVPLYLLGKSSNDTATKTGNRLDAKAL